jgi:hypothetical protein
VCARTILYRHPHMLLMTFVERSKHPSVRDSCRFLII